MERNYFVRRRQLYLLSLIQSTSACSPTGDQGCVYIDVVPSFDEADGAGGEILTGGRATQFNRRNTIVGDSVTNESDLMRATRNAN
jgi:hypothetical protein